MVISCGVSENWSDSEAYKISSQTQCDVSEKERSCG